MRMLKSYFRSNFGIIVLITLISVSQVFSLTCVEKIKNTYSAVSIRFSQPIQTERISRIRDNSARELTFWFQCEDMNISAGFGRITAADCIFYNGNGRNVYPAVFTHGGYPSAISGGCAISEKLSFQLFGLENSVGRTVTAGEKEYTVNGVFQGEPFILISCQDSDAQFTAAELQITKGENGREKALEFLRSVMPEESAVIIDAPFISDCAAALSLIPSHLLTLLMVIAMLTLIRRTDGTAKKLLLSVITVFLFVLMQYLMGFPLIPDDRFIPSKWSDFEFWEELRKNYTEYFTSYLSVKAQFKDVLVKKEFIRLILFSFLSCIFTVILALTNTKSTKPQFVTSVVFSSLLPILMVLLLQDKIHLGYDYICGLCIFITVQYFAKSPAPETQGQDFLVM